MNLTKKFLAVAATGTLLTAALPSVAFAASKSNAIPQGIGSQVLQHSNYFGNLPSSTQVTVDIVMKIQNKQALTKYIHGTTTPGSWNFRRYLSVSQFSREFAPSRWQIHSVTNYLKRFGIQSSVYPNHLVITATGTVGQFNKAFSVDIQKARYKGKEFHATRREPRAPESVANNILCILGLTNYSNMQSLSMKKPGSKPSATPPSGPYAETPAKMAKHYNVTPLYKEGAKGQGQTIGIVTLAGFNPSDAYHYWKAMGINVNPHRLTVTNVDNANAQSPSVYYSGYDETTLDVEQSGAMAPAANIHVYIGPNTDTGFTDAYAKAISENQVQELSVSWGESEQIINYFVQQNQETPEYAQVFNQLYMEAAAQGISTFASSGDGGAYDSAVYYDYGFNGVAGLFGRVVDNPADSPYVTAAGGTTLPWQNASRNVNVKQERAWGWDYYYSHLNTELKPTVSNWAADYLVGDGGGFSTIFKTPSYQKGVPGVNTYAGVTNWIPNSNASSITSNPNPKVVTGVGSGRNMPDVSLDADPETGYGVYLSQQNSKGVPNQTPGWVQYGGTSVVSPQLNGLTAVINSADHTRVGFWNPQIYRFAVRKNSPFTPLNAQGTSNDNIFYTGQPGTVYNQATGLGVPNVAKLAKDFKQGQWGEWGRFYGYGR
ncbi:protease pro-enzyme activation domain-containing protein [Alicyclobacillus sp. SO9]|uniref:S53 family peptidase n=1 Tax=Alicyclobacillus sp. SO9 TaxID=2665646 RepID=UPI0018E85B83|nr:S53 family peptidase [Alicyclobacillus sp. SO9]QQE78135.1 S8/S53 family peptidase [Alicyclobacillus sp. SO9]